MSDWGISAYLTGAYGSFGSVEFWVQDPPSLPVYDEQQTVYHHDGSDDSTVVTFGLIAPTLDITVACDETNYTALLSARNTSATLDYPGLPSSITARLKTVRGQAHWYFTGVYNVQLSFVVA